MSDSNGKPAGWFSRKHHTREPHDAARADYRSRRGRDARRERAQQRRERDDGAE